MWVRSPLRAPVQASSDPRADARSHSPAPALRRERHRGPSRCWASSRPTPCCWCSWSKSRPRWVPSPSATTRTVDLRHQPDVVGPLTYGAVTWLTAGNHWLAIVSTGIFFVIGWIAMRPIACAAVRAPRGCQCLGACRCLCRRAHNRLDAWARGEAVARRPVAMSSPGSRQACNAIFKEVPCHCASTISRRTPPCVRCS
jgi:hypothetical protein